ncbi:PAS domain-containing hybrid sensor histidine kinase/response regulator [Rubellimicrobium roseum]|uniref:histidine kinase n=1 Tax=Rubellimicrobium roseum TaxID=687525 RepID=A0A5C4N7A7_9RHOB|nr:PAS domain-containing hybrid sensor histidine kinase/response regulator [Rubellimicrobium roseum]TNC67586.1 response regulator [Rubellimicrobium roseum]
MTAPEPPEETREELYDRAPVGYLALDIQGRIVRSNATLAGWLGTTAAELRGRPVAQLLTPGARIFYETHCGPILRIEGELRQVALDLRRFDGSRLPALIDWRRVTGADGTHLGYRLLVVDASERRAYERELLAERERARSAAQALSALNAELEARVQARTAELVQLQKIESLGQLTGGVAHDFNNLLTPIVACLDILSRRSQLDPRGQRLVAAASEAAERARVLVSRLLTFARKQHLEVRTVDLTELVDGLRDLVVRSVGPMVALGIEVEPALPPARVDPGQLELALLNLCVNARDAMDGSGLLALRLGCATAEDLHRSGLPAGAYVAIEVRDRGCGMTAEVLRRATEPFFTTKTSGRGTGLGLSMVHGFARQSGGDLLIDSTPGEGTRVRVLLPMAEDAPALPRPTLAIPVPAARSLRVLLVDDDGLVRASIADMLRELGHELSEVTSGEAALARLELQRPDLLVTDHAMPGLTGTALAREARRRWPGLPVLLVTGFADGSGVEPGDLPRLSKPFGPRDLAGAIGLALGNHGGS